MATLYPYDANAVLHDGTAIVADGAGSVAAFDVGAAARFPAVAVVNVTACDSTSSDETYDVIIQGYTSSAFTTPVQLGSMAIVRGVTGRYTILFDNDQNGTVYEFIRVYFDVGGTTPSISANVYLAPLYPVS
jgi:hypothetical protein